MLTEKTLNKIKELYGEDKAAEIGDKICALVSRYDSLGQGGREDFLDEQDILLITYADTLHLPGQEPLKSLIQFCQHRLENLISIIHILPFFPYSSDDGFSVIDYRKVNAHHGDWHHIARLSEDFDLCFDLVLNHVSAQSEYFKGYLTGDSQYQDFFIELKEHTDISCVVRPRALPLLHKYSSRTGPKYCWTTFSRDQVDFNFKNPAVLLEMLDILLFYVWQGGRIIRLDAIAYLWKELGTGCVHLKQTHLVVQLMRDILDLAAGHVLLLSETNFPHEDNISYFGDGRNEAQIVYNFPLPPLVLYTLIAGTARYLTNWAKTIKPVSERTTFLNFTASHDGIGVRPAGTILEGEEFEKLIETARSHGGQVSCKNAHKGNPIPYELNINYFDALNKPGAGNENEKLEIDRFLLSQSIALVMQGIPAIYIHSLIGSRNWSEGVAQTGQPRSINREKLDLDLLEQQLHDSGSRRSQVFHRYVHMIRQRRGQKAFHPRAEQHIADWGDEFFVLVRVSLDGRQCVIAVHNVTGQSQEVTFEPAELEVQHIPEESSRARVWKDLIGGTVIKSKGGGSYCFALEPYQFVWFTNT